MIVVDASAVCAILLGEPEARELQSVLAREDRSIISPVNYWESLVSLSQRGDMDATSHIERLCRRVNLEIAAISAPETMIAFEAWRRFGKNRHPAKLNLGDCFAYGLAKARDLPLLFKGEDFAKTDIQSVL